MVRARTPQWSQEAEQSVLGSMLISQDTVKKITGILQANDFFDERSRIIFEHMESLEAKHQPIDYITLSEALKASGRLDAVGGLAALVDLSNMVPTAYHAEEYARIVKEKSFLRAVSGSMAEILDFAQEGNSADVMDKLMQSVLALQKADKTTINLTPMKTIVENVLNNVSEARKHQGIIGLSTGFVDLDSFTGGLRNGDLVIVAARPSMGKTSWLRNVITNLILDDVSVGMFSLEMTKEDLVQQMLFEKARLNSQKLVTGYLTDEDEKLLKAVSTPFESLPFWCHDITGLNINQLRAVAQKMKLEHDVKLIGVDYLQLIQGIGKGTDRREAATQAAQGLKQIARELDIPVVALAQLSRAVEMTETKRPMLSHLKESGDIEAAADVVAFLYRESYYNPTPENRHDAEFIVSKNRKGPTGTRKLYWEPGLSSFKNSC